MYRTCSFTFKFPPTELPHLDEHSPAQPRFDQRLGDPASCISSGSIHFGVIFSGESSASVPTPSSICVHDDFTPCESCITLVTHKHPSTPAFPHTSDNPVSLCGSAHLWASLEEFPTWQQMVDGLVIQVLGGNDDLHHLLHQMVSDLLQADVGGVLH